MGDWMREAFTEQKRLLQLFLVERGRKHALLLQDTCTDPLAH